MDAASPADNGASQASPAPTGRGRGRGRGRRGRPATRRAASHDRTDDGSGTPVKKKRGGWRGGFRGRPRRGHQSGAYGTRQPTDKDGNPLDVEDDEIVVETEAAGEEKVDKYGRLLGGREYRVRTFSIVGRDDRLYMLSTEPARCTGYRDSYLFFTKHPTLFKIILDEHEKKDLIEREILPNSYKGRAIGVVTARSVFREFGAKIVVGGKKVVDDYKVKEAMERGDVEGELADPLDKLPPEGEAYNRNQYVAWHGASAVYHQNAPAAPGANGVPAAGRKRPRITGANWMLEHARAASIYNSELAAQRSRNKFGVYDPHTNIMLFPQNTQPTRAIFEEVVDETVQDEPDRKRARTNGHVADTASQPVPASIARNYLVLDTQYITPPHASLPRPGLQLGSVEDVLGTGSDHRCLPDLTEAQLETFDPGVRSEIEKAKGVQDAWMGMWDAGTEKRPLKLGVHLL